MSALDIGIALIALGAGLWVIWHVQRQKRDE